MVNRLSELSKSYLPLSTQEGAIAWLKDDETPFLKRSGVFFLGPDL
jgi:hypothetical protein